MGREGLKNTLILLPVIGLMAGASYYLWRDVHTQEAQSKIQNNAEVIGVLLDQSNNVKRKAGTSLYWNTAKSNEALFSDDAIRTGNGSSAVIQLNDKAQIELAENSLIVLEKSASQLNVNFKTGDIETKGGSDKLAIKLKDTVLESQNADLKLRTDTQNNTQIIVTKGSATLTDAKKQKVEISTKKVVSVDEKGQAKEMAIALVLNTPKNKTTILDPGYTAQVPFTWTVLDDKLKEEVFEISSTQDFKKINFSKPAHQTIQAEIRRGPQYWRVAWKTADGKVKFSEIREVRLEEDKRLLPLSPTQGASIDFEPGNEIVSFSWTAIGEPKSFLLEVSKDADFKTIALTQNTDKKSYDATTLKEGKYFWRVRAFSEKNQEIGRTSSLNFVIRKTLPQIPQLLSPENGLSWTLNDPVTLEWKTDQMISQYKLMVSKDSAQTNIVHQNTLKQGKYLWKWAQPGDYYWNVYGLDDKGNIISRSVMHRLSIHPTITGPAIVLKTPAHQATVKRDRRDPMDPVVFDWTVERPIASGPFTFYISQKPDFTEAQKKEKIETTKFSLRLDKSANYYWKVEWINPEDPKDIEVSSTFVMKYRVSASLPAPQLTEPLDKATKTIARPSPVDFSWLKVNGAVLYRFNLERENPNTRDRVPVMSQTTSQEGIKSVNLEPGLYFWSVSSIDKEKLEGPESIKRSFTIELNKELLAPKLKAPVVK